jgi:hypothetical protein
MSAAAEELTTPEDSAIFDFDALARSPLQREPFDYLIVPDFLLTAAKGPVNADYPKVPGPGNYKPEALDCGPAFAALLDEAQSPAFARRLGAKFGVDLGTGRPSIGIRAFCEQTDGDIHTDHSAKIVTMLIYFNETWEREAACLRFLRSRDDIADYIAEVPPLLGAMVAFRRSENSFHGHTRFVGERRMLQVSWVREGDLANTQRRLNRLTKPLRRWLNMS